MMRVERGTTPISHHRLNRMKRNLRNGEYAIIHQANPGNVDEFFAQPIGPEPPPQIHQPGHPWLRNLGLVGLGAGLGVAGYHFRHPLMKLGQKVINYTTDKFHHLFAPTNETNTTTTQMNNRVAF